MWKVPFDESMLGKNLIIHCPDESLAIELMELLELNGIEWYGGGLPTSNTRWDNIREKTCYWVESGRLTYGSMGYAEEDPFNDFVYHIKCTFYGKDEPTFEPANDSEMQGFLGF